MQSLIIHIYVYAEPLSLFDVKTQSNKILPKIDALVLGEKFFGPSNFYMQFVTYKSTNT